MNKLPDFLTPSGKHKVSRAGELSEESGYQPLLAAWTIDIILLSGRHRCMVRGSRHLIEEDEDIAKLTGLFVTKCSDMEEEKTEFLRVSGKQIPRTAAAIARELRRLADRFHNMQVHNEYGIFANVKLLGELLGMTRAEQAVLCFATLLVAVPLFKDAISSMNIRLPANKLAALLAQLTGNEEKEIVAALQPESVLRASGIIQIRDFGNDLERVMELLPGLGMLLSQPHTSADMLVGKFVKKAEKTQLSLDNYSHLARDTAILSDYLGAAMRANESGSNVLLYGIPGIGKTEFTKALAASLGADLYEITYADANGDPVYGFERLRAYNLCQRVLAGRNNALLMFDEIEDVFPEHSEWQMLFSDEEGTPGHRGRKAWVNRSLEQNRTPAIWITNNAHLDKAYLRRFDYSVRFKIPPQQVRKEIARRHLGVFDPCEDWLSGIAANEQFIPAQYERAAKVARLGANGDAVRARELVEQALDHSAMLLGQKVMAKRNVRHTAYELRFVNTNLALENLLSGLSKRRHGTFCFYGPAGTGKSEFARHIADELGMPCVVRRASDILSMWVGGTEKNLAEMFAEARQQEAVLVLDEADSFLSDRRDAQHSWEVTQVNELLTQMKAYEGIFVCTTNLMEKLDQASLRRFAFKVKFDYLNSDQCWEMFKNEFKRLGGLAISNADWEGKVRELDKLTPGDFSVVARQLDVLDTPVIEGELYRQLQEECRVKGGSKVRIGFW